MFIRFTDSTNIINCHRATTMALRRIPPNDKIVHIDGNGYWWFWNEDWNKRIGPYDTEEEAHAALEVYIDQWDPIEYIRNRNNKEDPEYATGDDT